MPKVKKSSKLKNKTNGSCNQDAFCPEKDLLHQGKNVSTMAALFLSNTTLSKNNAKTKNKK